MIQDTLWKMSTEVDVAFSLAVFLVYIISQVLSSFPNLIGTAKLAQKREAAISHGGLYFIGHIHIHTIGLSLFENNSLLRIYDQVTTLP